jgi:hypothetical protein
MAPDSRFAFSIDLPIRSDWANVDLLRTSVQNCVTAVFSEVDGCQALAMVTGELLENAIKYGDWSGADGGDFRLRVWGETGRGPAGANAHVSVENPVLPDDPHVGALLSTLAWIATFPSVRDAYRAKLLEIAESAGELDQSGLGLVRIAYEGNCALSAEVDGRTLRVTADATF